MSSISGILGNGANAAQANGLGAVNRSGGGAGGDGDNDGSRVAGGGGRHGFFASAIVQALSQLGVSAAVPGPSATGPAAVGAATSTQDAALHTFMHDLFAALHAVGGSPSNPASGAQAASTAGADNDGDHDGSGSASAAEASDGRRDLGHALSGIESRLQTLIQQLSSAGSPTSAGTTASPASSLQTDFQNLLTSLGAPDSQASLTGFLQSIANNLQGNNPGLNVSAQA